MQRQQVKDPIQVIIAFAKMMKVFVGITSPGRWQQANPPIL
jgi:hypothetical protein